MATDRRAIALAAALLTIAAAGGCGDRTADTGPSAEIGPHGAVLVPLPDGLGFVEARLEPGPPDGPTRVVAAYFLGPDKAGLSPTPSAVRLGWQSDRGQKSVELKPEPRGDGPPGEVRFATKPGEFSKGISFGRLSATIDGRKIGVPVMLPGPE